MFQVHAKRQFLKPAFKVRVESDYEAFDMFDECIARKYKEVYITCVSKSSTRALGDVTRRRINLTREIKNMAAPQQVVGVRIGQKLLDVIGQYSDRMNKSQNGYIMSAIDFALKRDLAGDTVRLDDWGAASFDRQQFSIRIDCKKLARIDNKAEKINVSRSTWIVWAILSYTKELTVDDMLAD